MIHRFGRSLLIPGAIVAALACTESTARATVFTSAAVGGAPTGVHYVNFDNLPLGSAGGTSGGITVSITPDGKVTTGSSSGFYAAPYLSNNNGYPFNDFTNGPDTTRYLSTGLGTVTLAMPGLEKYIGLLWGSVDTYNTLRLFNGNTLVGTVTGSDVTASANGDQGINGTYYVNITSTLDFNKVVMSSSQYAFEFDNVSYSETIPTPEPSTMLIASSGLLFGIYMRHRRCRMA